MRLHHDLVYLIEHDLFGKPAATFPDHALSATATETAMTPQERQMVDDLFDRLSKVDAAPRDPDAIAAIAQGLLRAPNATYALVQTVLVQDEALKRAHDRIQELENAGAGEQHQSGGFLDSMRDTLFGSSQNQPRGSVPNVPPPANSRPVWNSGQVLPHEDQYHQSPYGQSQFNQSPYGQPPYAQPYGMPQSPFGGGGSGGGSFLGTAAAAAAGVVGGSLLLGSIRNMMGGHHQSFADSTVSGGSDRSPWSSDQSNSSLARDAGINDIGTSGSRDDGGRAGLFDQASSDGADHDDTNVDSDDFGGNDGNSDYA
jgi:uncharacterized protein